MQAERKSKVFHVLPAPPPDGIDLARLASKPLREKFDSYLTESLLARVLAAERLDASTLPEVARLVLEPQA